MNQPAKPHIVKAANILFLVMLGILLENYYHVYNTIFVGIGLGLVLILQAYSYVDNKPKKSQQSANHL